VSARVPDYVAIGHLTIDHTPRGDILGGSVLYAGLTAARYGLRTAILTRANIAALDARQRADLDRIAGEIEIVAQDSDGTTTFTNREVAGRREQTLHNWGGIIDLNGLPAQWRSARAIHLAPVAQEIDVRQVGRLAPQVLGCTPQGWMRSWDAQHLGRVRQTPLRLPPDLVARIDAIIVSREEFVNARDTVEEIGRRGLAAVTLGRQGADLIDRGRQFTMPVYQVPAIADTTGAGDVFAGGLLAARAAGQSVRASVRYAAAAAALNVSVPGLEGVPTRAAVETLIAQR
jgi:sugar/nucleoside kinase (ribokinase family)